MAGVEPVAIASVMDPMLVSEPADRFVLKMLRKYGLLWLSALG